MMPEEERKALSAIMEDLRGRLVAWLANGGFDVPASDQATVSDALDACLRVLHRSIPRRPRQVHRSNVLKARKLAGELQQRISLVESEITGGDDLNHRLTRRYFNAGFDDRLYNDLGVTHLHLGDFGQGTDVTRKRAMAGGGADLLWVIIKPLDAYVIDLCDHTAFESYDFVKVIYENWKHLLGEPLDGWRDVEPKLTPKERAGIRRAGLTTFVEHNGEIFLPGGYVSSGLSMAVRRASDDRLIVGRVDTNSTVFCSTCWVEAGHRANQVLTDDRDDPDDNFWMVDNRHSLLRIASQRRCSASAGLVP